MELADLGGNRESTHHASIEKQDQAIFVWKLRSVTAQYIWKPGQFAIDIV